MEQQWPPAPSNAKRIVNAGPLTIEFDGDTIHCMQPYPIRRRRFVAIFTVFIALSGTIYIGYPIATARWFSWAADWWVMVRIFAPLYVWVACAFGFAEWVRAYFLHTSPFTITRNPCVLRRTRGRMESLPETARLQLRRSRYLYRRLHVLTVIIPGAEGRKERRIALASFAGLGSANRAQLEISRFLE